MPSVTSERLRHVMGHFPTGVTIVTAFSSAGPVGMAANSFTSVSLDPPLILVCPGRSSETWPHIQAASRFCVNVVARHHAELTRLFSMKGIDRFAGVEWEERPTGPGLCDAVAWVECEIRDEHDAGDHTIVVADVVGVDVADTVDPLVFWRGEYGTFLAGAGRSEA